MGAFSGFAVTLRQIFRKRVTISYPEEKRVKPVRFHGRHVLNRYPDGMEKCIGCELCAGVCPARCIYVRGKENPPDAPVSPGERYGYVYEINMLRCIFCGLCVEACPTEAITMSHLFEMSVTKRRDAMYTRDELLMDAEGNVPHPQPAGPLVDLDELRRPDGWMRATAPSGRAAYEGVIAWTPIAGWGLPPAERGQSGAGRPDAPETAEGGAGLMVELVLFIIFAVAALFGAVTMVWARNADLLGAGPDADPVLRGRLLRVQRGALRGRRPGDRLRRGGDDPVPVRDHAGGGGPGRGPQGEPAGAAPGGPGAAGPLRGGGAGGGSLRVGDRRR